MISIVARFAAAMIGTVAVVEGYYAYLQKALAPPPAATAFQAVHDQWVAGLTRAAEEVARPVQASADAVGIRSEIFTTETEVIVTFSIPGLQSDSVKVAVDSVRVLITCIADLAGVGAGGAPSAAAGPNGMRQYELIMPLPAHADSARHRVVREKGAFRIIFTKLDDPSLKS